MLREVDIARDAGFVDGEGWIGIQKTKRADSVNPNFISRIGVKNTSFPAVERYLHYGGRVYEVQGKGNEKPLLQWKIGGYKMADVLRKWQPYLIVKAEQANVALEFLEYKKSHIKMGVKAPPLALKQLEVFAKRMQELNRRGIFGKKGYQESFL